MVFLPTVISLSVKIENKVKDGLRYIFAKCLPPQLKIQTRQLIEKNFVKLQMKTVSPLPYREYFNV